jgi:hypothetical protein
MYKATVKAWAPTGQKVLDVPVQAATRHSMNVIVGAVERQAGTLGIGATRTETIRH